MNVILEINLRHGQNGTKHHLGISYFHNPFVTFLKGCACRLTCTFYTLFTKTTTVQDTVETLCQS